MRASDREAAEKFLQELEIYAELERIVGISCGICERTKGIAEKTS